MKLKTMMTVLFAICGLVYVIVPPVYADVNDNWKVLIKPVGNSNSTYYPSELQAKNLETVEWTNADSIAHTVTSGVPNHVDYAGKIFDSGSLKPGEIFTFQVPKNSTWTAYYYFCKIHPWITGKIDTITPYLGISPILTLTTDKSSYTGSDTMKISAAVNETYQKTPLTIQIFDQHKNLVLLKVLNASKNKYYNYETNKLSSILQKDGNYKIKTLYGFPSVVTDTNFVFVSGMNSDQDKNFTPFIPKWIKNNAGWWSQGKMSDSDFVNGLQYVIEHKIIKIPETHTAENKLREIPKWVKNDAQLWTEGKISDNEFVVAITYLIQH